MATTDDLRVAVEELRLRKYADQYESQDDESDYDFTNDYESEPDADYMELVREVYRMTLTA